MASQASNEFNNSKARLGMNNLRQTEGFSMVGPVNAMHLHKAFGTERPQYLNMGMAQIFAANNRYDGKPLVGMTEAQGKLKILDRPTYRYELSGGRQEVCRIVKIKCTDPKPGQYGRSFEVAIDKPWWSVSDIVSPDDENVRFIVKPADGSSSRNQRSEGANCFVYTLQIINDMPSAYCDPTFLRVGEEWRRVSSGVADVDNQDGGGFHFYSIFERDGQLQQHSKKYTLDDKTLRRIKQAANNAPGLNMPQEFGGWTQQLWVDNLQGGVTGKPLSAFMSVMEAKMTDELYRDVENTLMFGIESKNAIRSPEGHLIRFASGLRQQLEQGYVLEYNESMPLEQLEEWFDSIMKNKISEGERNVVLSAGLQFRKMFDRMLKADAKTFTTVDSLYVRQGSDFRHLQFGAHFAEYLGFTVKITVMENPAYDNRDYSFKKHPVQTDTPLSSWRADILDFGKSEQTGDTSDNICMVAESYLDYHISYGGKYHVGYDGKTGLPITDGGMGVAGNLSGMEVLKEKSAGLLVVDVTRCGVIMLDSTNY